MFTATLEGEAELASEWGAATNLIHQGVSRGVMKGVKEGADEARQKHTFKNITGELEKSIVGLAYGWTAGGSRYEGAIKATAKYASYVENPTRPHVIIVRRATWLHWEQPQGDHHFARRVNHPGTKGLPFMHFAFNKCEAVMTREIEMAVALVQVRFA